MSRRPADQVAADRDPSTRQELWDVLCRMARTRSWFTVNDVFLETFMNKRTISSYLTCLVAGGFALRDDRTSPHLYHLQGERPVVAPRLRSDGSEVRNSSIENMWRTIRILGAFSARDVAAHATTGDVKVSEQAAKRYLSFLHRSGYLRVQNKAIRRRTQTIYRLISNTGPMAPLVQRGKKVFDPNLGAIQRPGEAA